MRVCRVVSAVYFVVVFFRGDILRIDEPHNNSAETIPRNASVWRSAGAHCSVSSFICRQFRNNCFLKRQIYYKKS